MTAIDPADLADPWRLELLKARHGAPDTAGAAASAMTFWTVAAVALGQLARTILSGPGDAPPSDGRTVVALHGELSNRTLPLITAAGAEAPATPVLLLGRPRQSLTATRALFQTKGLTAACLIRPWSLGAAITALPAMLGRLIDGARVMGAAPWRPAMRDQAAIAYRVLLGEVSARWLAGQAWRPRTVLFAHTGPADANRLEQALQARGAATVHWVHGVSLGVNFAGLSDVAVLQCGSDAAWHQALGGYGRSLALPALRPEPSPEGQGWLLLSNLAHPMNPGFQTHGPRDEIAVLTAVAEAADLTGLPRTAVTWKPHPILYSLPAETREALENAARRLGLTLWPHPVRALERAVDFAAVIVTPSTAALDVLRLGKLPVIHGLTGADPMSAIARLPVQTTTPQALAQAIDALKDAAAWRLAFDAAWTDVAPGRAPTLGELEALASGDDRL